MDVARSGSGGTSSLQKLSLLQIMSLTLVNLVNDAGVAFIQMYEVPLLLSLGMPIVFVTLPSLISGPLCAVVLLPLLGYCSDRNPNQPRRKIVATIITFSTLFLGFFILAAANFMKVAIEHYEQDGNVETFLNINSSFDPAFSSNIPVDDPQSGVPPNKTLHAIFSAMKNSSLSAVSFSQQSIQVSAVQSSLSVSNLVTTAAGNGTFPSNVSREQPVSMPLPAAVGFLGFSLAEIGLSTCFSSSKALILICSAHSDHTRFITLGMLMASLGGFVQAALALLPMGRLVGLGDSLLIRSAIQIIIFEILMVISVASSSITANFALLLAPLCQTNEANPEKNCHPDRPSIGHALTSENPDEINPTLTTTELTGRPKIHRSGYHDHCKDVVRLTMDQNDPQCVSPSVGLSMTLLQRPTTSVDDATAWPPSHHQDRKGPDNALNGAGTHDCSGRKITTISWHRLFSALVPLRLVGGQSVKHPNKSQREESADEDVTSDGNYGSETTHLLSHGKPSAACGRARKEEKHLCAIKKIHKRGPDLLKRNLVCACLMTFFGEAVLCCYNNFTPDFLGRAVYRGDPQAPPGSPSRQAYDQGVNQNAVGILILYASSITVNLVHKKLIELVGLKVDVVMSHLFLSASIVMLIVTKTLWVFYFTAIWIGYQRVVFHTVPFIVASDYVHYKSQEGHGPKPSSVVSLVTCMMPLLQSTAYPLVGPLIALTGVQATPFYISATGCVITTFVFLFYTKP